MRYVLFKKCLAVLSVLVLTVTGVWAAGEEEGSTATAADKKYVTDPTTGKVVVAPEYGGTLIAQGNAGLTQIALDPLLGYPSLTDGVIESLGIVNWGVDRDVWDLKTLFTPDTYLKGALAEGWDISPTASPIPSTCARARAGMIKRRWMVDRSLPKTSSSTFTASWAWATSPRTDRPPLEALINSRTSLGNR